MQTTKPQNKLVFATVLGAVFGCVSFAIGPLSTISQNTAIAGIQKTIFILLLPGIVGGMALGGNAHAFSIWGVAIVNFLLYFGVGWLVYSGVARFRRRRP